MGDGKNVPGNITPYAMATEGILDAHLHLHVSDLEHKGVQEEGWVWLDLDQWFRNWSSRCFMKEEKAGYLEWLSLGSGHGFTPGCDTARRKPSSHWASVFAPGGQSWCHRPPGNALRGSEVTQAQGSDSTGHLPGVGSCKPHNNSMKQALPGKMRKQRTTCPMTTPLIHSQARTCIRAVWCRASAPSLHCLCQGRD